MVPTRKEGHLTAPHDPKPSVPPARPRRPWSRPRILFREPLETLATVCAPSPPAKGSVVACPRGPISS